MGLTFTKYFNDPTSYWGGLNGSWSYVRHGVNGHCAVKTWVAPELRAGTDMYGRGTPGRSGVWSGFALDTCPSVVAANPNTTLITSVPTFNPSMMKATQAVKDLIPGAVFVVVGNSVRGPNQFWSQCLSCKSHGGPCRKQQNFLLFDGFGRPKVNNRFGFGTETLRERTLSVLIVDRDFTVLKEAPVHLASGVASAFDARLFQATDDRIYVACATAILPRAYHNRRAHPRDPHTNVFSRVALMPLSPKSSPHAVW